MIAKKSTLLKIHASFAQTSYGKQLASQIRYERYKPSTVSNDQWVELLGADVNNLTHLTYTLSLAEDFIETNLAHVPGLLSDADIDKLRVAALIHDWAESIVGDISYSDKTQLQEDEEKRQLNENLKAFYPKGDEKLRELIELAGSDIVFSPETRLGKMFNAVERIGYYSTALKAADHIKNGTASNCENGLRWLVADVLHYQTTPLLEYARQYPAVNQFISDNRQLITGMFDMADETTFANYPDDQQSAKREQFLQAKQLWTSWIKVLESI